MAIKVTLGSIKAGVSKTTQTANLGGILADLRRKILLVDIDVQPTLSCDYLVQSKATIGFTHLITDTCVDDVISQVTIPDLDIVLSDDLQGRLRNVILPTPDGRVRLKHILIRLEDTYNFILIDTQGGLNSVIPSTVAYRQAATARQAVHRWEPHRSGPTPSPRETLQALVHEQFAHLSDATLRKSELS